MRKLLLAACAALAMAASAHAKDQFDCGMEYIDIQTLHMRANLRENSAADYELAALRLKEPVDKKGIEYANEAKELAEQVKVRAQAFVANTECNPVDRADIKHRFLD